MDQVGIDHAHNLSAQRLILFKAARIEDLEPDLEIRVADENGRILLVTVSLAVQEPALSRTRVFYLETAFRLSTRYLARRSLILVPVSSPKRIRGSP